MRKTFIIAITLAVAVLSSRVCFSEAKPDPKALLDTSVKQTDKLAAYKLIFEYEEAQPGGKKNVWRKCEYWFMGRDFLRLAVLEGDDKGSRVAYNVKKSKTKVMAKPAYSPVAIPVEKNDQRLEGFFASDLASDMKDISNMVKGGAFSLAGEENIKDRDAWKISIKTKNPKFDAITLWLDKKDSILLQYEYENGGKFQQRKTWYDINLNPSLTEKDFRP